MKFSIVTISFNQAEFLEQAIRSVIEQDVDLEYIVVDPGSTDGSREIIERYRDHIDHIVFEPDKGPADGLNKGMALASGDVLACLNSDDYYLPSGLRRAQAQIEKDPDAGAWIGAGKIVDREGRVTKGCYSNRFSPRLYALRYAVAIHQATFYAREAFEAVGGFNPENWASWDGEILYWIMRKGYRVSRNFEQIGGFRIYDESLTGSGQLFERLEQDYARLQSDLEANEPSARTGVMRAANSKLTRALVDPAVTFLKLSDAVARRIGYR